MRNLKFSAGLLFGIGIGLAVIWVLQEFGVIAWLDNPETGAIAALLLGMMLQLWARKVSSPDS